MNSATSPECVVAECTLVGLDVSMVVLLMVVVYVGCGRHWLPLLLLLLFATFGPTVRTELAPPEGSLGDIICIGDNGYRIGFTVRFELVKWCCPSQRSISPVGCNDLCWYWAPLDGWGVNPELFVCVVLFDVRWRGVDCRFTSPLLSCAH